MMSLSYLTAKEPFTIEFFTWRQLLDLHRDGKLDSQPAFQRGDASSARWKSYVIGGFLQRTIPTVIALRKFKDGTYQLIDGLQRITAVLRFLNGLVRTPQEIDGNAFIVHRGTVAYRVAGKSWKEIQATLEGKYLLDSFLDTPVNAMVFNDAMTDEEASRVFAILNDNTDMTPAEKLNGYLGAVTALGRLLARGVSRDCSVNLKDRLKVLGLITLKPGRMVHDDLVYRCMLMEMWHRDKNLSQGIYYGMCDVDTQRSMILGPLKDTEDTKSAELLAKIGKELHRRSDIVASWITLTFGTGEKPLYANSIHDLTTLFQLTYAFEDKFGRNYKFNAKFATNLFVTLTYLHNRKHADHRATARFVGEKTVYESIKTSLRPEVISKKLRLILDKVGDEGITRIDNKVSFSRGEVFSKWAEQDKKCMVTGLPLAFEDAVGGHRKARALGHPTEYANLVVIHKAENAKMGVMSYDEYMTNTRRTAKSNPREMGLSI